MKNLNRRDFLKAVGLGTAGINMLAMSSLETKAALRKPTPEMDTRIGAAIRVKPALLYHISKRKEATSWRQWGGLKSQQDVDNEVTRIEQELKNLSSMADFPIEVLPVAKVTSNDQSAAVIDSDYDVILLYASGGKKIKPPISSTKPNIMFVRHKSGPVYYWYETAHPIFLRNSTDEYKKPGGMDVWDVVVDDYNELLWRLRALYGLKNTVGTRIVAIGGTDSWSGGLGPATAKEIWKLDIIPVTYEQLGPMIKKAKEDSNAVELARRQTDEYLAQKNVSLQTDKKFLINAFLLTKVFRELMEDKNACAITISRCMSTIMSIAQTTACMPLSLINDEGLMAFCESDFVVIPAGILLRYISGKPVFLNDPTYPHDGVVTCAHCTAPRRMNGKNYEPAKILTHFESDYGAAPKVQFSKGQLTTNLIPNFSSTKWVGFKGKIIDHPFYDICRSQMDIQIQGDWKRLLEDMRGFHWMTCYGDYLREVGYALKKVGIEWENISEPKST